MKTKTKKRAASSAKRSHGKKAGTGRIGTSLRYKPETHFDLYAPAPHIAKRRLQEAQAEAEAGVMDCPYVAVVLKADEERTRSTYKTADEAYAHAVDKIGSIARTQHKRLTFAICKVVEIVEPVSPNVARRAPKKGDGTTRFKIEDLIPPNFVLHPGCRSWITVQDERTADVMEMVGAKKYGEKNWSSNRKK